MSKEDIHTADLTPSTGSGASRDQGQSDVPIDEGMSWPRLWRELGEIKLIVNSGLTRLDSLEERMQAVETAQAELAEPRLPGNLQETLDILVGRMSYEQNKRKSLERELLELKAHTMKRNIIFHIDEVQFPAAKEMRDENATYIVRNFLHNVMKVDYDTTRDLFITVAHRIGGDKSNKTRPIIAQFPVATDFDTVLYHASNLKNTTHYINQQVPQAMSERNQFAYPTFKDLRNDKSNRARLAKGQLFVKGDLVTKYLPPILPEVLNDTTEVPVVSRSQQKEDSNSTFVGFSAQDVTSMEQLAKIRDLLLKDPDTQKASHIVMAYRIQNLENFDSDGDDGTGLQLLKFMREKKLVNCAFFATRLCKPGYKHIGPRRFQHMKDLCYEAYNNPARIIV